MATKHIPEMVKRVEDAIHDALVLQWKADAILDFEALARAAIGEMREPTKAMREAGHQIPPTGDLAENCWHKMIDAALE